MIAISTSEIDLDWSPVSGATGYLVERSSDGGTAWVHLPSTSLNGSSSTFADTSVAPGTVYEYQILSVNAVGDSPATAPGQVVTLPNAPVLSASVVSSSQINLSWAVIPSAAQYTVQLSADGGNTWTTLATQASTSYSATGLADATSFAFRIFAGNPTGNSAASNIVSASTPAALPPTPDPVAPTTPVPTKSPWYFKPNPTLPNVLILGDSISIGYTPAARSFLAGKANVYRPLTADGMDAANCGGTTLGLADLDSWLALAPKWNVIHFNFGLHDLEHVAAPGVDTPSPNLNDPVLTTPDQYRTNLQAIVAKLKTTGAKLIFATTTPVPVGAVGRTPDEPAVYNAIAMQIMKANGIAVDDLNTFITPYLAKDQQPGSVHYFASGYDLLGHQVASSIEAAVTRN